jgi:hypothetical protein
MQAVKGSSMEKWLCWGALGVAGLFALLFLLDVVAKFPFGGLNKLVDILGLLSCLIVAYLGWDALQDLR